MKLILSLGLFVLVGTLSSSAFADVKYIRSSGGKIVEVATGEVEATCKHNFAFRETKKEEVLPYLQKDIVKAAFQGKMLPSLETVISSLKSSDGTCAWITSDEKY